MDGTAVVLAPHAFNSIYGKTAHALVRDSDRYEIVAVVDPDAAGGDAGVALDGRPRGIPIFATLREAMAGARRTPDACVVGIATTGGRLSRELRADLREAAAMGLSIVNGLHDYVSDDHDIVAAAAASGARIVDVRKPRPRAELHTWTGEIAAVRAPRIAVLGTDCAVGKLTAARLLVETCRAQGLRVEMVYTGQTGWMQGGRYGVVLDALPNDFVPGELEHAVVSCDRAESPDLIVIEGQSALRNPGGPCGAELILSARTRGVVLQHVPGRPGFLEHDAARWPIPPIDEEIALIRLYGARVLAVTLNGEGLSAGALVEAQGRLAAQLALPVLRPLEEGLGGLLPVVRAYIADEQRRVSV